MGIDRKFIVDARRDAARRRLDEANKSRAADTKAVEQVKARFSLGSEFKKCIDAFLDTVEFAPTQERIKELVTTLLSDCNVTTAEALELKNTQYQFMNQRINPMYHQLETFIAENKMQGQRGQLSSFWNMVATELQLQLDAIAEAAGIPPSQLGNPSQIITWELLRKDD